MTNRPLAKIVICNIKKTKRFAVFDAHAAFKKTPIKNIGREFSNFKDAIFIIKKNRRKHVKRNKRQPVRHHIR